MQPWSETVFFQAVYSKRSDHQATEPNKSLFSDFVSPFFRASAINTSSSNTAPIPQALPHEIAANRASIGSVAKLLGELWLREVTLSRLHQLHADASIGDSLKSLGLELPHLTADAIDEKIEDLAIDYCQLLIGPKGHISPVQSVWVAEQFQSTSVDAMKSFFELLPGYQPPGSFHDHVGVQLDFAGSMLIATDHLAQPESSQLSGNLNGNSSTNSNVQPNNENGQSTAIAGGNPVDDGSLKSQQSQADQIVLVFFHQQLSWTGPLIAKVKTQAQTTFYRQLADVTEKFLALFDVGAGKQSP